MLKKNIPNNLNLIIGDDEKQISFYIQDITSKLDYEDANKIVYDLHDNKFSDILDEASMISLFANTKVIIGNNLDIAKINDADYEYLNKYIENINKDAYIILTTPKVDARLKNYKIFKDNFNVIDTTKTNNQDDLLAYIKNKIDDNNYQMDNYNIEYFLGKVGNDINNINNELSKLFTYKEDSKIITKEDIDLLINDNIDTIIYEFTNAVLENDLNQITKMYNNFKLENISPDYLLVSLSNIFRQALIIKLLANDNKSNVEIAKVIGKKEFYVKKMLERLYQYTIDDLCNYINKLALIDKNNKLGNSNIDELELFLINMNY